MADEVVIERLGQRGEGIAQAPGGRLYVPYALPGETVRVDCDGERGTLLDVLRPSPARITPICGYFGRCGGCAVQALDAPPYAAWKRGLLQTALSRAGLAVDVASLVDAHGAGRRRATFHARACDDGSSVVGYMEARSHAIVAIDACPILDPGLRDALPAARAIARALVHLRKPLDILATATASGLDIDLRGPGKLADADRHRVAEAALAHDVARLSNHGVVVIERRRPVLSMGAATLEPPPGAFLQATEVGEILLAARVSAALEGAKRVADLFAGVGTFALRLAERAEVAAFDADVPALDALSKASRLSPALRAVRVEARDLFRRPLQPDELARFDAVVLDPPRAGAETQGHALAQSSVPVVASVACDAQSFARDAAILVAAGYRAELVEPLDQFRYSPHMEIFGLFRREVARKKRRLLG